MAQKYCITGILALQRGSALRGGVWVGAWERGPGGRNTRNGKRFDPEKLVAFLGPNGSSRTGEAPEQGQPRWLVLEAVQLSTERARLELPRWEG